MVRLVIVNNITSYTASEARKKLYSLVKKASESFEVFEIRLRGKDPVLLISKEEVESWMETLDILSNPKEVKAIEKARKEKEEISLEETLTKMG